MPKRYEALICRTFAMKPPATISPYGCHRQGRVYRDARYCLARSDSSAYMRELAILRRGLVFFFLPQRLFMPMRAITMAMLAK